MDRLERYIMDVESALKQGVAVEGALRTALESRDVIGQAKGILMEREGVHEDEALAMLETISQKTNVELREVAILLIARTWGDQHPGDGKAP